MWGRRDPSPPPHMKWIYWKYHFRQLKHLWIRGGGGDRYLIIAKCTGGSPWRLVQFSAPIWQLTTLQFHGIYCLLPALMGTAHTHMVQTSGQEKHTYNIHKEEDVLTHLKQLSNKLARKVETMKSSICTNPFYLTNSRSTRSLGSKLNNLAFCSTVTLVLC